MKRLSNGLIVALSVALAACGKPEPVVVTASTDPAPQTLPTIENAVSVEQAEPAVQTAARSVVRIERAEGFNGSGFFVSPRIILTNHHVVPAERCSPKLCPGVTAIRGFYPGGENQVFHRLRPLAYNRSLDFMFLEVLDGAAPVEGLPLANADEVAKLTESDPLSALGHPLGAPMKASPSTLLSGNGVDLELDSAIFHGNSGGPLVHVPSGKVVGIIHRVSHDLSQYDIGSKMIPFKAWAIQISPVVAALHRDQPGTRGSTRWDAQQFRPPSALPRVLRSLFLGPSRSTDSFFALSPDIRETTARASLVVEDLESDPGTVGEFLSSMVLSDLKRGKISSLSASLLERIEKSGVPEETRSRFLNFYDPKRQDDCVKNFSKHPHAIELVGQVCHRTSWGNGISVLNVLKQSVDGIELDGEEIGVGVFNIMEGQIRLRQVMDQGAREAVVALLPKMDAVVKHGITRARLDYFKLLWETHPELLLNGGFANSF